MASLKKIHPTFFGTFVRQMKLLRVIGVDIFEDSDRSFVRKHGRFMFFTSMALFMFVGQILYVLKRKEVGANFLNVVDAIPSILITIQNQVKLSVLVVKKNEIKKLILDIGKLWKFDYENMKKNEEMNFWIRRLKIWNDVMFAAMALGIVFFAVMPMAVTIYRCFTENEPQYTFLLNMYFFKGVDSFLTYSIAVAYQAVTCSVCQVCLYTPCDYLILNLSFSLAAFLRLIQIDLIILKGSSNLEHLDFNRADNCEDIKMIVKTHQMLLSLAERLNRIFKEIIFSQVYLSSVIICCYLFTAMFQMSKYGIAPILANLMASFSVFVEIFILALPGQVITDTSSSIADAAYQSPWYKRSCKFRKFLAILIVRSQRPFHLSALGFSDLTLVMFSKVVSTTWSYLSLLNQMTENLDLDV